MLPRKLFFLSKRNYLKNLAKIATLVAVFFLLISLLSFFKIKIISCLDNGLPCSENIELTLKPILGTSALYLKQQKIFTEVSKIKPIKKLTTHYRPFNHLKIDIESENKYLPLSHSLVLGLPKLSFNTSNSSTSAMFFQKPSLEISSIIKDLNFTNFHLWFTGDLTPVATQITNIYFLSQQKPEKQDLKSIFELLELTNKYLKADTVYILEKTVFLSREEQPDIITSVPYNRELLLEALHSLGFLTTMKTDPKIIDLIYKNPIIR